MAETDKTFQIFKGIVNSRSHWKWFDPDKTISEDLLKQIMETAQRAPSSFNTQPYKVILVRENEYKLALAEGMLETSNKNVVLTADTSAVFLADLEVVRNIPKIQELWRTTTAPNDYVEKFLPMGVKVQSVGFGGLAKYILRFGVWALLTIGGLFSKALPQYNSVPSWAYRQTGFFADHFLLAATAAGLKAAVMEGLSGSEISRQLKIPSRYRVFCVMALGYPKEGASGRAEQSKRFDMKDVYYRNNFGNSM